MSVTSSGVFAGEMRDVVNTRVAPVRRNGRRRIRRAFFEMTFRAQHLIEFANHVNRQAHRARLIHDRALDALRTPPRGIRRKRKPGGIEFFDRGASSPELPSSINRAAAHHVQSTPSRN